ncbi:MAG: methyltransferase domain-containing protein [Nitrospirae bacterium]|nr:methyltransferase domain-containing protein [Nitrospirota bacterium]
MGQSPSPLQLDVETLRSEIRKEYAEVACHPRKGFHFHTGRPLAEMLGYPDDWVDALPSGAVESFAGTGNPFRLGELKPGERVVDVGSGARFDSLIAARLVGPTGYVLGVDMTPEMQEKARRNARLAGYHHVEFREGLAEALPVPDGWADIVISNGVLNLLPDKSAALAEMRRVLKPEGRLQIADILVRREVPQSAKQRIDLWTG